MVTRFNTTRGIGRVLVAMLVAVTGSVAVSAWSMDPGRHGMGPGMFGGRMSERMLDGVNATEAQRAQIKQIMQAAAADLRAQGDTRRTLAERAAQVFAAPTVDANAAEQVRLQMLVQHDQTSRRMLAAMLDVSRVLTPEQRAQLAERMKERSAKMHERHQRMQNEHGAARN